jgi:hypothetical protein
MRAAKRTRHGQAQHGLAKPLILRLASLAGIILRIIASFRGALQRPLALNKVGSGA